MTEPVTNPVDPRPTLRLKPGAHRRALGGHPWIYSNEIQMTAEAKALPPGGVVRVRADDGRAIGSAFFNPHTLIAARLLTREVGTTIDRDFLAARLRAALALRERLVPSPHYRLIHAEADGLPGTVIDRFGDVVVAQVSTAGMELLTAELLAAIDEVLAPATVLLKNDSAARGLEGLDSHVRIAKGALDGPVEVVEHGTRFLADLGEGQKTGWFFDQRDNRMVVARLAASARVLDVYSYCGGFALQAAVAGAAEVLAIDRSQAALDLGARAAALNGAEARCRFVRGEAFQELERLADGQQRFDIVVADPPAFIKSKKDAPQGARAYRKLARLSATLVRPQGFLFIASCSHHIDAAGFASEVRHGIAAAGRGGRVLLSSGAAPDHPVHPFLPESAYLKGQLLQLD
jgi:23S rRNA (cytosine1962-C5)-methyltransferase